MDPQLCNTLMEENQDDDDDDDDDPNSPSRNVSAAGVVRGVSRSIARSIAKPITKTIPKQVPKITKQLFTRRGQLRVKGVAKVSDRLSTGWEVYSSAKETVDEGNVPQKKTRSWIPVWNTVRMFTTTLLRNSLVGTAVFETYVYTIAKTATGSRPDHEGEQIPTTTTTTYQQDATSDSPLAIQHRRNDTMNDDDDDDDDADDDDDEKEIIPVDAPDDFSRASIRAHVGAGALAGSVDGLLSSLWESKSQSKIPFFLQKAPYLILQQCLSHALLFGSYEWWKRKLIQQLHSSPWGEWKDSGLSHLICIGLAGGVAGQLQTLTNHYGEQIIERQPSAERLLRSKPRSVQLRFLLRGMKHPSMGSMMAAFVPSAVGFVAFEYGKRLGS
ncbi:hypothetical protein FisN_24Lh123 [Fistulifera solaris]|uniref:Uncharacterized protein n=1 Tax=Fistulifera solaris TaxID=1519565 RepID=A0A1Z5K984_FISSO|nr:hypothetical protein FisN_24Lh123 [Fistulifera solaris]|eukprot:GAX22840.1 hypothetical protein FisN_24Lh123 [Fistulifera solaris]